MTMYRVHKASRTVEVLPERGGIWTRLQGPIEAILPEDCRSAFNPQEIGEDTVYRYILTDEP